MKRLAVLVLTVLVVALLLVSPVMAAPLGQEDAPLALTPELLAAAVGVLVSLLASYVPGFRDKWATLSKETMQLTMAGSMVVIGVAIYLLACLPGTGFTFVACPTGGWWELFKIIGVALISNQTIYRVSPQTERVKETKALR